MKIVKETFFSPVTRTSLSLIQNFRLMISLFRREIMEKHAGQFLGWIWMLIHPLVFISVYLFLFTIVFQAKVPEQAGDLNYTVFMLSGLVPWLFTQQAANISVSSISDSKDLIKQVVFPLEIMPVKAILAASPGFVFSLFILFGYMAFSNSAPGLGILLLPIALFFHILFLIGCALLVSIVGVYVRDLKEIIQLIMFVGTFVAPIFYLVEWIPKSMQILIYLNPFSHIVIVYRDVLLYGDVVHPWSWLIFALLSVGVYIFGTRFFQWAKHYIGDML